MICLNVMFGGSCITLLLTSKVKPRLCSLLHTSRGSILYSSGPGTKFNSRAVCIHSVTFLLVLGVRSKTPSCTADMKHYE